jgi:aminomethyltransferase
MSEPFESATLYIGPWYRKSPFFDATVRAGCTAYDIYNHMLHPNEYRGQTPEDEYRWLVNDVTLWDVGVERIVEISGPDASRFTNSLTCRDLTRCEVMQAKYMLVTTRQGGIVNDPVLIRIEEDKWWMALSDSDAGLYAMGAAVNSGLKVEVTYPEVYPVQVQGPKSREVMRDLFGEWVTDIRYYRCARAELGGIPVVISRTGWSAVVGYEIYLCDPARADELWDKILEAGEPYDIHVTGSSDIRRIEAGIFDYGADMNIEDNPFEFMGLERLVEEQDEDYVGKEALEQIRVDGVRRKVVGIELEGEPLTRWPLDHWPAFHDGNRVGKMTSSAWSPRLEKNIGYVWVPIDLAGPGNPLEIHSTQGILRGTTAALPFMDPQKKVPSS